MANFIYNIPSFLLFIFVCCLCVLISFIALKLIHRHIPLKFRYSENQATVSVTAILGIIYAVLVGFIILYEFNNFNKMEDAESLEAKSMFAIYRLSVDLPEPHAKVIRMLALDYANTVIHDEWPMMVKGKPIGNKGAILSERIGDQIRLFKNVEQLNTSTIRTLDEISMNNNALFDAHQQRISKVHSVISPNIWFVLLLGSFLTLAVNYMLGMEFHLHMISVTFISLMIAAVLYLVITLDRPYQGDFSIEPRTFIASLEYMTQTSKNYS